MSHINQEDGTTVLARSEEYHFTGRVLVEVEVDFTCDESCGNRYEDALFDAIQVGMDDGEWSVTDCGDDDLDMDIETKEE